MKIGRKRFERIKNKSELMKKQYDYILFDLDGTLIDSKPGIVECIRYALDKEGVPYTSDVLDKMIGPPFRVSMHDFLGQDEKSIEKLIALYRGEYEKYGWKHCRVFDGVRDMLAKLQSAGKRLAVATSKPIKFTDMIVKGFDIEKFFDVVGGASSDASKEAKCDVINDVLERLDVTDKRKVLMVGDRMYDIDGAHVSGIDVCAVLYGYGSQSEFEEHGAEYIVDLPCDVCNLVL